MKDYKIIYEHKITKDNKDGLIVKDSYEGEEEFNYEAAMTVLLLEKKIILNSYWWQKDWGEEQRNIISAMVVCNDVFIWGSADAEALDFKELKDLFNHYEKDPIWGTEVWCIKKRGIMPQQPVFEAIQAGKIWDLNKMNLKKI